MLETQEFIMPADSALVWFDCAMSVITLFSHTDCKG